MAMKRTIADLVTRFTVSGLQGIRAQMQRITSSVTGALRSFATQVPLRGLVMGAQAAGSAIQTTTRMASTLGRTLNGVVTGFGAVTRQVTKLSSAALALGAKGLGLLGLGGIGAGGTVAFVGHAVNETQDYIQELEKVASTVDMPIEEMSRFSIYAQKYGLEIEDIRQAMTQFYGVAGQAAQGNNEYAETFKRLGLDMSKAENRALNMTQLFEKFARQMKTIRGNQRTYALSQIFGDDDATRVAKIVDAMGKLNGYDIGPGDHSTEYLQMMAEMAANSPEALAEKKARKAGAIVTESDLQLSQEYNDAVTDLGTSVRGLRMEIFRAFGKPFIVLMTYAAQQISKHRYYIVAYLLIAWRRLIGLIHDFIVIFGNFSPVQPIQNQWIYPLKQVLGVIWEIIKTVFYLGIVLAKALNNFVYEKTGKGILEHLQSINVENVVAALRTVEGWIAWLTVRAKDFFYVLTGQDGKVTTRFGFTMAEWRDAIIQFFLDIYQQITPIVQAVATAISQMVAGFQSGEIDRQRKDWYNFGATLAIVWNWLNGLVIALWTLFTSSDKAEGSFAWLNGVKSWLEAFLPALQKALGWFGQLFDFLDGIFRYFGVDLRATLLFIGILQFTGLLKWLIAILRFCGSIIRGLWMVVVNVFNGSALAYLRGFFGHFVGIFAGAFSKIGGFFRAIINLPFAMASGLTNFLGWAASWAGRLITGFPQWLAALPGVLAGIFRSAIGGILVLFTRLPALIAGVFSKLSLWGLLFSAAWTLGEWLADQVLNGFLKALNAPFKWIVDFVMQTDRLLAESGRQAQANFDKYGPTNFRGGAVPPPPPAANYGTASSSVRDQAPMGEININVGNESYPAQMSEDVWDEIKRKKEYNAANGVGFSF